MSASAILVCTSPTPNHLQGTGVHHGIRCIGGSPEHHYIVISVGSQVPYNALLFILRSIHQHTEMRSDNLVMDCDCLKAMTFRL